LAFGHGKNVDVYINGYDLTAYFNSFESSGTADTVETTTFSKNSKTYIPGNKDANLSMEGFFDGASDVVDEVLQAALGSSRAEITWYPQGDAAGNYGYGFSAIETNYTVKGTIDDATKIAASAQSKTGKERVLSLHALGAESDVNWEGAVQDNGAGTSNGGSAYLHVMAATGTIEVKIQHSSDNFSVDTEDLATFTAVTGRTSERITFAGIVKQYVRGYATIAGSENITFNLSIHRD